RSDYPRHDPAWGVCFKHRCEQEGIPRRHKRQVRRDSPVRRRDRAKEREGARVLGAGLVSSLLGTRQAAQKAEAEQHVPRPNQEGEDAPARDDADQDHPEALDGCVSRGRGRGGPRLLRRMTEPCKTLTFEGVLKDLGEKVKGRIPSLEWLVGPEHIDSHTSPPCVIVDPVSESFSDAPSAPRSKIPGARYTATATVQFHCWGKTYDHALEIRAAVAAALWHVSRGS